MRRSRPAAPRTLATVCAVAGAFAAAPAAADVVMPLLWDLGAVALPLLIPALFLEAIVLAGLLGDRYGRALMASVAVNAASALLGALLGVLSVELGVTDAPGSCCRSR
ncbi:MAG: hypothetical protein M5T61_20500 [Acidimicrobiia bacterium]|nr:hypothetical protein [Acidimicrobiia bacterium]